MNVAAPNGNAYSIACFFFSSRRRHTRFKCDWSSDVCSSDLFAVDEDLTYSGTVAAAMEATLLDIPAIALSQHFIDGEAIPWQTAARFAPEVIRRLTRLPWPPPPLMNINFPASAPQAIRGAAATSPGHPAMAA